MGCINVNHVLKKMLDLISFFLSCQKGKLKRVTFKWRFENEKKNVILKCANMQFPG